MDDGIGKRLLSLASDRGVDQAEVFIRTSRLLSIEVRKQGIDYIETSRAEGISLRVIRDGRVGFAFSESGSDPEALASRAAENAAFCETDEGNDLPFPAIIPPVDVCDQRIVGLTEKDAVELVMCLEDAALSADRRITKIRKAGGDFSVSTRRVMNSRGVDVSCTSTTASAQITVVAEDGLDSQMGWEFGANRFLHNLSFEAIGRRASEKALSLLNGRKIASCKAPVLLSSDVAADFLSILSSSFSYESVLRKRSLLAGRQGEKIVASLIDIVDDGLRLGETGSRPFDGEGVPSRQTVLVAEGVLGNYLHNTYTARKSGAVSTGNAARGGSSGMPVIGVSNVYIKAARADGHSPFAALVGSIARGLHVTDTMGMHTANPVSGDFSIGASGIWIERGEPCGPVREVVISGNLLDLFGGICMIGDDLAFYGNIGSPSLLIENADISG